MARYNETLHVRAITSAPQHIKLHRNEVVYFETDTLIRPCIDLVQGARALLLSSWRADAALLQVLTAACSPLSGIRPSAA